MWKLVNAPSRRRLCESHVHFPPPSARVTNGAGMCSSESCVEVAWVGSSRRSGAALRAGPGLGVRMTRRGVQAPRERESSALAPPPPPDTREVELLMHWGVGRPLPAPRPQGWGDYVRTAECWEHWGTQPWNCKVPTAPEFSSWQRNCAGCDHLIQVLRALFQNCPPPWGHSARCPRSCFLAWVPVVVYTR